MVPPFQLCWLQNPSLCWAGSTPCLQLSLEDIPQLWHLKYPGIQSRLGFHSFIQWPLRASMQGLSCNIPGLGAFPSSLRKVPWPLSSCNLQNFNVIATHPTLSSLVTGFRQDLVPPSVTFAYAFLCCLLGRQNSSGLFLSRTADYLGGVLPGGMPHFIPFPIKALLTSIGTSLGSNITFPGAFFLLKLYALCFFLLCLLFLIIDLPKNEHD